MKFLESESASLELKRDIPQNDQIIKTIIGFCNQHGGTLVIGVENDGTIIGVPEEEAQRLLEYVEKSIIEASYPPIITRVYTQRITDKTLLFIDVAEGMNKPYFLKREGKAEGVYIRLGRSTLRANEKMIEELKLNSRGISFDVMPVYQARVEDLDTVKITNFLSLRKSATEGNFTLQATLEDAMNAYHITVREADHVYPTTCGMLLFGKNPQYFFSEARIMCNHFPGITMGGEVITSKECLGTIDEQFKSAFNFIISNLNRSWKLEGTMRVEKMEIPEVAIREIIMNAVIHRNYNLPCPIKIAIFDNRIEIFSPGIFPGPLANNLRSGFTYLRNPAICKIFREMGFIENFGLGFITTFASYEREGLKTPDVIEGENFIKCILPRRVPQNLLSLSETQDQELAAILNLFSVVTEISVSTIIEELGLPRATATRKLSSLVKKGHIKKIGLGRGVRYVKNS